MKLLFTLLYCFIVFTTSAQTVEGVIISQTGEPLKDISVRVEGGSKVDRTDSLGRFKIQNIKPGFLDLIVTGAGYHKVVYPVSFGNKGVKNISIILYTTTVQLQEISVSDKRVVGKELASYTAAKLPLKDLENPQAFQVASANLMREQAATDQSSVMKNFTGITKSWSSAATYYTSRGFNTRSYIRNGIAGFVTADADLANVDQLVAVKGPSGTLFGGTLVGFGGLLNRITKKPVDKAFIEFGYQNATYGLNRITADINQPLNKDILFRINTATSRDGSFQDAGFLKSNFIAPAFTFHVDTRLIISVDAEIYNRIGTSLQQIVPAGQVTSGFEKTGSSKPQQLPISYAQSFSNNRINLKQLNRSVYGEVWYKVNHLWTSKTNISHTYANNTGNYLTFAVLKGDSLLARNLSQFQDGGNNLVFQIQQNFEGDFRLGKMRNRLVVGLDWYRNSSRSVAKSLNGWFGKPSYDTLNLKHHPSVYPLITTETIDQKISTVPLSSSSSISSNYAVYASNVINLTDALSIMTSLRFDRTYNDGTTNLISNTKSGNYRQTAVSPKLGFVYQLIKDKLSFFGNYNSGFVNVASVNQPDGTLSAFKPQYANQLESGFKYARTDDHFSATISYYRILVTNTLRSDVLRPNYTIQDGMQSSKGIEFDLIYQPLNGWMINSGIAYNNSKLINDDSSVTGLRPINSGPALTINFYSSYQFQSKSLKGAGISFGSNYWGQNLIINSRVNGQFKLDGYTVFNAGAYYDRSRFRLSFNIDNVTNQQYYTGGYGTYTPGMLRRYLLGLIIRI